MHEFSLITLGCLAKAGWYTGRKIPTFQQRAFLDGEGYAWFPKVQTFLEEFDQLLVPFTRNSHTDIIRLDACVAASRVWFPDYYAPRIGDTKLCVIGSVYSDHLLLFMDRFGRVYGGFDEYLCLVSNSGCEAIEAICLNQQLQELPKL